MPEGQSEFPHDQVYDESNRDCWGPLQTRKVKHRDRDFMYTREVAMWCPGLVIPYPSER